MIKVVSCSAGKLASSSRPSGQHLLQQDGISCGDIAGALKSQEVHKVHAYNAESSQPCLAKWGLAAAAATGALQWRLLLLRLLWLLLLLLLLWLLLWLLWLWLLLLLLLLLLRGHGGGCSVEDT